MANRVQNNNNGSYLEAYPQLQQLDETEVRDITKEVRDVYGVEKKSDNWKSMAVNAGIILAAAVAILVLGILGAHALIGIGAALMVYGLYQAGKAVDKGLAHKAIVKVHDDATVLRLSKKVQENQLARQGQQVQMANLRSAPRHFYPQGRPEDQPVQQGYRLV